MKGLAIVTSSVMKQLLLVLDISMQKVESFIGYLPCNGECFDDEESLVFKKNNNNKLYLPTQGMFYS